MSKPEVGDYWQYKFAFGTVVTGQIMKIRCFGLLHLIKYRTRWDHTEPAYSAYCWKFCWKAVEKL